MLPWKIEFNVECDDAVECGSDDTNSICWLMMLAGQCAVVDSNLTNLTNFKFSNSCE